MNDIIREMIVRKMPFEFPEDIPAHWHPENPEWSHMVSGASLAMPFLEPYLIRTIRKAFNSIEDQQLQKDVRLYMAQEGQHYQQHRKFNDILIAKGYTELEAIEQQMRDEFASFEKLRSQKFNVGYACGFESMALGIGHWLIKDREFLFGGADSRVSSLILWHFVEEIEHKNVAFDTYQALYGKDFSLGYLPSKSYFFRVYATLFATLHVVKFSRSAYQAMLKKDGLWSNLKSRWRLLKMTARFLRSVVPWVLYACLPGHHPSDVEDPEWYQHWLDTYQDNSDQVVQLNAL
ncbi:MAG: metal-dependent hydrolase [Pseudomonadota bacterium]|nr:metal-dependent hydrolase [Pseudomonadota bacterium]